jgi:hypothetical protein
MPLPVLEYALISMPIPQKSYCGTLDNNGIGYLVSAATDG